MANWSQSHFLQSLGWATLNSFWQMALLWCIFLAAVHIFRVSSNRKYQLAVSFIVSGFAWFLFTFFFYYFSSPLTGPAFLHKFIYRSGSLLNVLLLSASLAYLALLIFPSYKLYLNWRFVQRIKKDGLQKAGYQYRLFVQKIAMQLGISRRVSIFVSDLVRSPLTVGYIKPIILLPVAALNNLSPQQVEAILLHELSHIRRFDYLVNLMISVISTILYFNPFVKLFVKAVEEERENCCDQLVIQYGYDRVGYATALLTLEKMSVHSQVLALGAAGRNTLLNRVEKIVGLEKKKGFNRTQLTGMLAALFCIFLFNSVLILKETRKKQSPSFYAYQPVNTPVSLFEHEPEVRQNLEVEVSDNEARASRASGQGSPEITGSVVDLAAISEEMVPESEDLQLYSYVALDDVDASLTAEQKEEVKTTVENTRKVISGFQWKEIEKDIADAFTESEKMRARQEYMNELEKTVNFQKLEQNLKSQYAQIDLERINANLDKALSILQLDSLQNNYEAILVQLEKAQVQILEQAEVSQTPLPDQSLAELKKYAQEVRKKLELVRALRSEKKVIRL